MKIGQLLLGLLLLVDLTACASQRAEIESLATATPTSETRQDLAYLFEQHGVVGSFVLYDQNRAHTIHINPERNDNQYLPASTFKILNSLIGLETAVVVDQQHQLAWDGTAHPFPEWNRDHTLETAIANSVVWYYQHVARQVGAEQMAEYVQKANYGNQNIGGDIDTFWLEGELRISPNEQISFLRGLYDETLPFSARTMQIVKEILVVEQTDHYRLSAKTGLALRTEPKIGWWVGYIEQNGNVYFFALNIEDEEADQDFRNARFEITRSILQSLNLL